MLTPDAAKAIGLTTVKVELRDLERMVSAHATVEVPWRQRALVTTLVGGRIERVLVSPGQAVEAGDELARLESLELESLQLELLQTAAELGLAERIYQQQESLAREGAVASKGVFEARREKQHAAARMTIVREKLHALGLSQIEIAEVLRSGQPVATLAIVSPRSGVVSQAHVRSGQRVEPDQALYEIVDPSHLWILGQVLESDLTGIRKGLKVRARFESLPGEVFEGAIEDTHLALDPVTRMLVVRADYDNASLRLKPGMFGRMEICTQRVGKAVVCPPAALVREGEAEFAILEDAPGKFLKRTVKIGLRTSEHVEILDGLFPGDRVALVGNQALAAVYRKHREAPQDGDNTQKPAPGVAVRGASASQASSPSGSQSKASTATALAQIELPTSSKFFATAPVEGRVRNIFVEHCQWVDRGQILAEIESLELRNLQLDLLQTKAQLAWIEQGIGRLKNLGAEPLTSRKQLWQLEADQAAHEHRMASVRRKLAMIGLSEEEIERIEDLKLDEAAGGTYLQESGERAITPVLNGIMAIRAPASGWVADFHLTPGQVVKPQEELFELHETSRVWVHARLFERDARQWAAGQEVEVRIASDPTFAARATITRVGPALADSQRVQSVWAELENAEGELKEGMSARLVTIWPRSAAAPDSGAHGSGVHEPR
jgi:RND family efflux transporter MFP subunit